MTQVFEPSIKYILDLANRMHVTDGIAEFVDANFCGSADEFITDNLPTQAASSYITNILWDTPWDTILLFQSVKEEDYYEK